MTTHRVRLFSPRGTWARVLAESPIEAAVVHGMKRGVIPVTSATPVDVFVADEGSPSHSNGQPMRVHHFALRRFGV